MHLISPYSATHFLSLTVLAIMTKTLGHGCLLVDMVLDAGQC